MVDSREARWVLRCCVVVAGVVVAMLATWIAGDPIARLTTDWTAFDNAADRLLAGDEVYRPYDESTEPFPYLYPPPALWLSVPLAAVGFELSWVLSAGLTGGAMLWGLVILRRLADELQFGDERPQTGLIAPAALSGIAIAATLIGQYSGLWVLSLAVSCRAFVYGHERRAGFALALLILKPHIAVAVPIVLLWSRSWRALGAFVGASGALIASSVVFGVEQWVDFRSNIAMMADFQRDGLVPFDKMVTTQGVLQHATGWATSSPAVIAVWLLTAAIGGAIVLRAWSRQRFREDPVLAFGVFALFVVVCNLRIYFYDGLIAVAGAMVVAMRVGASPSRVTSRLVGALVALMWLGSWAAVFGGPYLAFVAAAVGLLAIGGSSSMATRTGPPAPPLVDERPTEEGSIGLSANPTIRS